MSYSNLSSGIAQASLLESLELSGYRSKRPSNDVQDIWPFSLFITNARAQWINVRVFLNLHAVAQECPEIVRHP